MVRSYFGEGRLPVSVLAACTLAFGPSVSRPKFRNWSPVSSESSGEWLNWAGKSRMVVLFVPPKEPGTSSK